MQTNFSPLATPVQFAGKRRLGAVLAGLALTTLGLTACASSQGDNTRDGFTRTGTAPTASTAPSQTKTTNPYDSDIEVQGPKTSPGPKESAHPSASPSQPRSTKAQTSTLTGRLFCLQDPLNASSATFAVYDPLYLAGAGAFSLTCTDKAPADLPKDSPKFPVEPQVAEVAGTPKESKLVKEIRASADKDPLYCTSESDHKAVPLDGTGTQPPKENLTCTTERPDPVATSGKTSMLEPMRHLARQIQESTDTTGKCAIEPLEGTGPQPQVYIEGPAGPEPVKLDC